MDAHPSFNVHNQDVKAVNDIYLSNLRSVGGSVRDSVFSSTATNGPSYFQSLLLTDPSIYNEYKFIMDGVEWYTPNISHPWKGGIDIYRSGRVEIRNTRAPLLSVETIGGVKSPFIPRRLVRLCVGPGYQSLHLCGGQEGYRE
jgi:hypothetical protein